MKRLAFLVVTILLVILVGRMVMGGIETKNTRVYYESVSISRGDTLWEIAEEYNVYGASTKSYVTEIMKFNHMENENIVSGQKILVPVTELEQAG